nr:high light inducible protein [Cryptomonas curvata]
MEKETKFLPWVWGFTTSAENWNGRMAMLGFLFTILIESITGKGVIHFLGVL